MTTLCLVDISLTNTRLSKFAIDFGGRRYITTSKLGVDQGAEFENKVVKQLQDVFGYKKTKTTPYRLQGNSVSERMHSTLHAMLSMYSNIAHKN